MPKSTHEVPDKQESLEQVARASCAPFALEARKILILANNRWMYLTGTKRGAEFLTDMIDSLTHEFNLE